MAKKRASKLDKWVAEEMEKKHPYTQHISENGNNWRVRNVRTCREAVVGASQFVALEYANQLNINGYIES